MVNPALRIVLHNYDYFSVSIVYVHILPIMLSTYNFTFTMLTLTVYEQKSYLKKAFCTSIDLTYQNIRGIQDCQLGQRSTIRASIGKLAKNEGRTRQ